MLLSAKRTWEADGVPLSIVNCAPRMIEDLKLIGIDRTLRDWRIAPMSMTILTVDDSRTMRDMLKVALMDAGYRVIQAVDGQNGLEVLEQETPQVIITDINMPKLDGFGFIESVRRDQRYLGIPILVLTTESSPEKKNLARRAGATGWIVKPFDSAKLVDVVRRVAA